MTKDGVMCVVQVRFRRSTVTESGISEVIRDGTLQLQGIVLLFIVHELVKSQSQRCAEATLDEKDSLMSIFPVQG